MPTSPLLTPLSAKPVAAPRAPVNGGNTCYIDSVLVALFADFDGCDGLLTSPTTTPPPHTLLHTQLRTIVNHLRAGRVVAPEPINKLRKTLVAKHGWPAGHAQQDAVEFFTLLLDALHAPFVPLVNNLTHAASPDLSADHAPFTERVLSLHLYSSKKNSFRIMVNKYFYAEVLHDVRRVGAPEGVDATVSRSLIPAYTPHRETGETVTISRTTLTFLTVPFSIVRFDPLSRRKNRAPVHIPTALPATAYVSPFANDAIHTLMLRSVVCHLGRSLGSGHYVTYTYSPRVGWCRWDDMEESAVPSCKSDVKTGAPENRKWADEISTDSYIAFYELVPGDREACLSDRLFHDKTRMQILIDSKIAAAEQAEEDHHMAISQQAMIAPSGDLLDGAAMYFLDADSSSSRSSNTRPRQLPKK